MFSTIDLRTYICYGCLNTVIFYRVEIKMTKTRGQKNIPVKNCRLDLMVLKTNHHVKILQHSEKHDNYTSEHIIIYDQKF